MLGFPSSFITRVEGAIWVAISEFSWSLRKWVCAALSKQWSKIVLLHCFFIHDTHIVYSNRPSLTFWKINIGKNVIISENVISWLHFFCTRNSSSEPSYSILQTVLKTQSHFWWFCQLPIFQSYSTSYHLDIEKAGWKKRDLSRLDRSLT